MFFTEGKNLRKIITYTGIVLIVLSISAGLYMIIDRERHIYPSNDAWMYTFSDEVNNGSSKITASGKNAENAFIDIDFRKGFASPFAGIGFDYSADLYAFPCDSVKLETGHSGVYAALVFLIFKSNKYPGEKVYFQAALPVNGPNTNKVITLKEFSIPDWWFAERNLPFENVKYGPGFHKLENAEVIYFGNAGTSGRGALARLSLYRSNALVRKFMLFVLIVAATGILLILAPFVYSWQQKFRTRRVIIPYKTLGIESEDKFWKDLLHPVVSAHIRSGNSDKQEICDALKVSERELNRLIRKYARTGYTAFIGTLKIDYACELLERTEKSVLDIAGESGFGSLSRFNLLFKKTKGMAPTAYRRSINAG